MTHLFKHMENFTSRIINKSNLSVYSNVWLFYFYLMIVRLMCHNYKCLTNIWRKWMKKYCFIVFEQTRLREQSWITAQWISCSAGKYSFSFNSYGLLFLHRWLWEFKDNKRTQSLLVTALLFSMLIVRIYFFSLSLALGLLCTLFHFSDWIERRK